MAPKHCAVPVTVRRELQLFGITCVRNDYRFLHKKSRQDSIRFSAGQLEVSGSEQQSTDDATSRSIKALALGHDQRTERQVGV